VIEKTGTEKVEELPDRKAAMYSDLAHTPMERHAEQLDGSPAVLDRSSLPILPRDIPEI
jgi:hypothetical protein